MRKAYLQLSKLLNTIASWKGFYWTVFAGCAVPFVLLTFKVLASENLPWYHPALKGFVEATMGGLGVDVTKALLHETGEREFMLRFGPGSPATEVLRPARLEHAIGVVYRPDTERPSHYFHARVAEQFDAIIHIDQTRAVEPLERTAGWERGEAPETYPFAV